MQARIIDTMATTATWGWPKDMQPLIDQVVDVTPHPHLGNAFLARVHGYQRLIHRDDLRIEDLGRDGPTPEEALRLALPTLEAAVGLGFGEDALNQARRALGITSEEAQAHG